MLLQRLSSASCRGARALQHTHCLQTSCLTSTHRAAIRANWHLRAAAAAEVTTSSSSSQPAASNAAHDAAAAPAPAYKVPLDFKFIRDNVQMITENCRLRNSSADPALVAQLYEQYLQLKAESEALRASRNENSAAMKVRGGSTHDTAALVQHSREFCQPALLWVLQLVTLHVLSSCRLLC